jgi:ATP-dependent protease HslVU (ClpYQ) peptidase subunit
VTTIAAIQGKSWAVVGYDSRITEESRLFTLSKDAGKVVRNGPYLLGAAGDLRAINLLSHNLRPPLPSEEDVGVKLDKFISIKFIPALKKCFDEAQYGEKGEQDSTIIVVIRGCVYEVGSNYDWCQDTSGLYALGTGGHYALGAMSYAARGKNLSLQEAKTAVRNSITIASRYDPSTGGPVHVVAQE